MTLDLTSDLLHTPFAVIDLERFELNTAHMSDRAHQLGVRLRPHVKTHKTIEGAERQVRGGFRGITVSTLAEAESYAAHGFRDITYGVPITPGKVSRAISVSESIDVLSVLVDTIEMVNALADQCAEAQSTLSVLIKIDCGYGRAGIRADDPHLISIVRLIDEAPYLYFEGILTHAGHAYHCHHREEIKSVAHEEYTSIIQARDRLISHGFTPSTVSIGSTPTATVYESLSGVTEMRPGNYALFDVFQASIGSCSLSEIALSVVTEIIAYYPERGEILIDAGALALSKDQGPTHLGQALSYGRVCTLDLEDYSQLSLVSLSQEHGKLRAEASFDFQNIHIGDRLRILPNHSCLVTALYDRLQVMSSGQVIEQWSPIRGW